MLLGWEVGVECGGLNVRRLAQVSYRGAPKPLFRKQMKGGVQRPAARPLKICLGGEGGVSGGSYNDRYLFCLG